MFICQPAHPQTKNFFRGPHSTHSHTQARQGKRKVPPLPDGKDRTARGHSRRIVAMATTPMRERSQLFQPYRAVGFVTDGTPFHLQRLGNDSFLTLSTGKAWQVFNCDKLRLTMIGQCMQNIGISRILFVVSRQPHFVCTHTHHTPYYSGRRPPARPTHPSPSGGQRPDL